MSVVICPRCKLKVSDHDGRCFACGAPLPKALPEVPADDNLLADENTDMVVVEKTAPSPKDEPVKPVAVAEVVPTIDNTEVRQPDGNSSAAKATAKRHPKARVVLVVTGGMIALIFANGLASTGTPPQEIVEDAESVNVMEQEDAEPEVVEPAVEEAAEAEAESAPMVEEPPTTTQIIDDGLTTSQRQALKSARGYLSHTSFSHDGLVRQLEYEQFPTEDAVYAADNCGADWYDQALKSAKGYLSHSSFSKSGLQRQLEYEQFTEEEAAYGVENCGADWYEQAVKSAKGYLDHSSFSLDSLIHQLEYEGFTPDEASYGANTVYNDGGY